MTLIIGGNNPAQALLFAYLVAALINPDITYMRSRANLLSLFWAILAICLIHRVFLLSVVFRIRGGADGILPFCSANGRPDVYD